MTKPTRGILDPEFKYVPSHESNLRLTFARERRRLAKLKAEQTNVTPIKKVKA